MKKEKIAIVCVRYGNNVVGGGEVHIRQYANILKEKYEVEIITTKSTKAETWENDIYIDEEEVDGILVRRFMVDKPRDIGPGSEFAETFEYLSENPEDKEVAERFIKIEGPYSQGLLSFLEDNQNNYRYFLYWPYQFATTVLGSRITPIEKNILLPTAHNEPNLYFSYVKDTFKNFSKIIYNTEEEKDLINKVHKIKAEGKIVSMFIENKTKSECFRDKYKINFNYCIYVGRIEDGKGVGRLMQMFINYVEENKSDFKLVLVGRPIIPIPKHKSIVFMGFLSEEDKIAAISESNFLIQSSKWESLSIVAMEAFLEEKPILVNGKCDVLKGHCIKSNGGLWYNTETEFNLAIKYFLENPEKAKKMGENGKRYAKENYNKAKVIKRLLEFI